MRICAVIPFYNESRFISEIISKVLQYVDHIIAVDDGSTDSSSVLITPSESISLIRHDHNKGKGAALKSGFIKSIELGFDATITIDADLQHDPRCIPQFIDALKFHDIIIGNRLDDISQMPISRILSNKITSKIISRKIGIKIKDSQSGFRAFRNERLPCLIPSTYGFEAESEILILAGKNSIFTHLVV